MAEEHIPISKARAEIANLTKLAQAQMRRYVLTHQGAPQAVLLGHEDYRSLKAAADLAHRPEIIENILSGQSQIREGKTIPLTEVKRRAKAGQPAPTVRSTFSAIQLEQKRFGALSRGFAKGRPQPLIKKN